MKTQILLVIEAAKTYFEFISQAVFLPYQTLGNWSLPLYIMVTLWLLTKVRVDV